MASSSGSLVTRALSGLGKFFKKPWEITGPVCAPDFYESLVQAGTYRPVAPASQTVSAIIPQAKPELVYDIKYFNRDLRRADVIGVKELVDPSNPFAPPPTEAPAEGAETPAVEAAPAPSYDLPATPGKYFVMGKAYHINDVNGGDGYGK